MGKLDEIIGKRSAEPYGRHDYRNPFLQPAAQNSYSGRVADHADLGGEIDRDEVPLALQRYVREYMEQVRKQADDENNPEAEDGGLLWMNIWWEH